MSYQLQFFEAIERNSQLSLQQRNKNKPVKVVFVSHLYTLWGCFSSLVTEMQKRSSFQVAVLPVRFAFDDPSICLDHIEHPVSEMLQQGIPVVDPKSYNFNIEKPDIAFFSTPYSFTREFKYSPSLLAMNGIRSVLIPYCTELIGGDGFQSFYLGHCNHLWRVFTASEHSSELYKLSLNTPGHFTPVLGNPEYDLVINTPVEQLAKYQHIKTQGKGRKIILWTPHFKLGVWSTWDIMAKDLIRFFADLKDEFFVVLRPHQHLTGRLLKWKPGMTPENHDQEISAMMHDAENFWLDSDGLCIEPILACDALISDVSSLLAKAMVLNKSILYTSGPSDEGLGLAQNFLEKHIHTARDIDEVKVFVDMLQSGQDPLVPVPRNRVEAFCGPADGKTAVRMADYLEDIFFKSN